MKYFNINEYIYIKINSLGWSHLRKTVGESYIKNCIESRKVTIEGETWYKMQCHQVFELFTMIGSFQPFFETTILFDDKDIKNK